MCLFAGAALGQTAEPSVNEKKSVGQMPAATGGETVAAGSGEGGFPAADSTTPPDAAAAESEAAEKAPPAKPLQSLAVGANPAPEPPSYALPLSEHDLLRVPDLSWLDVGLEQRTRFELRSDDYRKPNLQQDEQFLLQSRLYLGMRELLDPFRFTLEVMDSRQFASEFPNESRDVNEIDVLQAHGELYFEDALGSEGPLRLQFGRMTIEAVDRKLLERANWGNTINSYDGARLRFGGPASIWSLDIFATRPVERKPRKLDGPDDERWLYGVIGGWRAVPGRLTLEPYGVILDEDRKGADQNDRTIYTMGLHAFGRLGDGAWDFDLDGAFQFGEDGDLDQRAFAGFGELGYTFKQDWKPRVALSCLYAGGDGQADDTENERFDRLTGTSHLYATTDFLEWRNIISPKVLVALKPGKNVDLDASYALFWLASDNDAWTTTGRRAPDGDQGTLIGQEVDLRFRVKLTRHADLEMGYAYFIPGVFVRNTGPADDADFFYIQTTVRF